jgi:hypothetical protein
MALIARNALQTRRACDYVVLSLGVCLLSFCAPSAAVRAQSMTPTQLPPTRLGVLELAVDDVGDATARELCEQLRSQLAERPEFQLRDTHVTLAQLSLAENCDSSQEACLAQIARKLAVDSLVFGTMSNDSAAAVARLSRFDAARGAIVGSALATLVRQNAQPEDLEHKASQLINDLFELGQASSPFARPLAREAALAQEIAARKQPDAASDGDSTRNVAGYALLGGAVLSASLSVVSFVEIDRAQRNEAFDRYRRQVGQLRPLTSDVCDEAAGGKRYGLDNGSFNQVKSSCSAGKTFEVLQFVFLGGAVLSGGLSAYLFFSGSKAGERPIIGNASFNLQPNVYRRGATLNARFRF